MWELLVAHSPSTKCNGYADGGVGSTIRGSCNLTFWLISVIATPYCRWAQLTQRRPFQYHTTSQCVIPTRLESPESRPSHQCQIGDCNTRFANLNRKWLWILLGEIISVEASPSANVKKRHPWKKHRQHDTVSRAHFLPLIKNCNYIFYRILNSILSASLAFIITFLF